MTWLLDLVWNCKHCLCYSQKIMEFISLKIVNIVYKAFRNSQAYTIIFKISQIIIQRPITNTYQITKFIEYLLTIKSPWGIKTHGNMCHCCPFCKIQGVMKEEKRPSVEEHKHNLAKGSNPCK